MIAIGLALFVSMFCMAGLFINAIRLENRALKEEQERRAKTPWNWD